MAGFLHVALTLAAPDAGGAPPRPGAVACAMELLAALITECLARPHVNRADVSAAVSRGLPGVLAVLDASAAPSASRPRLAPGAGSPASAPPLGDGASLGLDALAGLAGGAVTMESLWSSCPPLALRTVSALAVSDARVARSACNAIVDLAAEARQRPSPGATPRDAAALDATAGALGALRPRLVASLGAADAAPPGSAGRAAEHTLQELLCRATASVVQARAALPSPGASAGALSGSLALLRSAMDSGSCAVLREACDAWAPVVSLPREERAALLPAGGLADLLPALLRAASYPDDTGAWDGESAAGAEAP